MGNLISTAEALDHLRIVLRPGDERQADVDRKVAEAEAIVVDYLKHPDHGWTQQTVPFPVKAGIKIILTALWDDREGTGVGDYLIEGGSVARLLVRFRDPSLA